MKKKLSIILSIFIFCITASTSVISAAEDITVYVDNKITVLTDANGNTVYPFIQDGTTYIPVRGISQALNCTVQWDGDNKNVLIYKDIEPDNKVFRNNSDDVKLYVDNEEQTLYDANDIEVKPFIKGGTTYVPLRGVSNALGYPVEWEGQTKSVYVWKDNVSPNGVTLDFLRPYETIGWVFEYYGSDGDMLEIDGEYYTNALSKGGSVGISTALFNLDGKYDTLTCVVGHTDWLQDEKTTVTFIVDGKIVKTIEIEPNSFSKEANIDLQKGLQLKIMLDGYVSLGNITFYGE